MNTLSTVVVIPYWIAHTLRRRNLPYTTLFNFPEMVKYFSHQDLALLRAANLEGNLGTLNVTQTTQEQRNEEASCVVDIMQEPAIGWNANEWYQSDDQARDEGLSNALSSVMNLAFSDHTQQMLMDRLYSEDGVEAKFDEPHAFVDLGRKHIGLVIHPGYFIATTDSPTDRELLFLRQYELTRAILLALYVQAPGFHLVASSPVFLRYLGLLSKKRMILA
jgi:hypothetical protein